MTNTIETAKNYQYIKKVIDDFNTYFLTYKLIPLSFITLALFVYGFQAIKADYGSNTLDPLYIALTTLAILINFSVFLGSLIAIGTQMFGEHRYFVTSHQAYYKKHFTDIEKSLLENFLDDTFDNIIQQNRKVISKKLKDVKEAMENEIFNQEYLESFKKDIEANLKERKQYIPLLQSLAEEYHFRDRDNVIMERANQQLSKAGISTFRTKAKPNFEIIEEMS